MFQSEFLLFLIIFRLTEQEKAQGQCIPLLAQIGKGIIVIVIPGFIAEWLFCGRPIVPTMDYNSNRTS